jgi:hypothetical protein
MPSVASTGIDRAASIARIFFIIHDDLTPSSSRKTFVHANNCRFCVAIGDSRCTLFSIGRALLLKGLQRSDFQSSRFAGWRNPL